MTHDRGLHVETGIPFGLPGVAGAARDAETAGYDGVWTMAGGRDPFLPAVVAAEHTQAMTIGTGPAAATGRNPWIVAQLAADLQAFTRGRFVLGLDGTIGPHAARRLGVPATQPRARLRELILAVRAIWASWEHQTPLAFRGQFYRHTTSRPAADPGPPAYGVPPIYLAGTDPATAELAGEVADGLLASRPCPAAYFHAVIVPALARGAARAGRSVVELSVAAPVLVITGATEADLDGATAAARRQIAFAFAAREARDLLDHAGWPDLHRDLAARTRRGRRSDASGLIDDAVLAAFAVAGEPSAVGAQLRARYGPAVDRVTVDVPGPADPEGWQPVLDAIRAGFADAAARSVPPVPAHTGVHAHEGLGPCPARWAEQEAAAG